MSGPGLAMVACQKVPGLMKLQYLWAFCTGKYSIGFKELYVIIIFGPMGAEFRSNQCKASLQSLPRLEKQHQPVHGHCQEAARLIAHACNVPSE